VAAEGSSRIVPEGLSVCSGARTMELDQEPRKGNIRQWKLVPVDWLTDSRLGGLSACVVNCRLCELVRQLMLGSILSHKAPEQQLHLAVHETTASVIF
jgi:hypothetical protein